MKMLSFIFLVFAIILLFFGCGTFNKKIRESRIAAAEEAIAENSDFKETDDVCKQIPLPEGTKFIEKARLYKSVGLSNYYYSDKKPEELEKFFRDYFTKNGWQPLESDTPVALTADFKNDKFEVAITLTGVSGVSGEKNFSIECEKLNTKQR